MPGHRCSVLSGEGERSEVFAQGVAPGGQRKHHVVCLSGTATEGTKTFCPYGGAAVAAVGRAKQSAPEFRGLTIPQSFSTDNRHTVRATVKTTKDTNSQVSDTKKENKLNNQEALKRRGPHTRKQAG